MEVNPKFKERIGTVEPDPKLQEALERATENLVVQVVRDSQLTTRDSLNVRLDAQGNPMRID